MPTIETNSTLYEEFQKTVQQYPQKDAMVIGDSRNTFEQLGKKVDGLAAGLYELGIRKGDKVALILPVCAEALYAFFALYKIGAPVVPLNPQLRVYEVKHILGDSEAVALITLGEMMGHNYVQMIESILPDLPELKHVIVWGEGGNERTKSLTDLIKSEPAPVDMDPVQPDDMSNLIYTSGTTGLPKGAVHTNRSILKAVSYSLQGMDPETYESMLNPFPLFHFAGILVPLVVILTGGKLVLMDRFHPVDALKLVDQESIRQIAAAPQMVALMLRMKEAVQPDLSSLRQVGVGGGKSSPEFILAIQKEMHCSVINAYGVTETGIISITRGDEPVEILAHTVGRAPQGIKIKIVDENRQEVPVGSPGEIATQSDQIMQSYYNQPELTAEVFDEDGWYYTGDMGSIDQDGYVRILDRKKDMIVRGAENIYPAEIENYLNTHPKIQNSAVIGIPSEVSGEKVRAYVLPAEDEEITDVEVVEFCRGKIAAYKIPEEVRIVESLPLTGIMKVEKYKLREEALRELEE